MTLTFLGTGTSCGVPVIGCQCEVCQSTDPKDKRTRCSALVETDDTRLLIDCGPDFRQQILPQPFRKIDAILITHAHYDHMGGMDDIRPYCRFGEINVYADPSACQSMLQMLPYCFAENRYPGVPAIGLHEIVPHESLHIGDFEVVPFVVMHGKLPILGYRIGKLTYITDMKTMDKGEMAYLEGTELLLVDDAIAFARRVGAKQTYLIHSCHDIGLHEVVNQKLPADIQMAYDGQMVIF